MSKLKVLPHETLCPGGAEIEAVPGTSIATCCSPTASRSSTRARRAVLHHLPL